ncbi:MAG: DNA polymerase III subunit alpha [Gammaproteobacteria bacterium]
MFVHLHLHSEYSLSDGLIRIDELLERTVALGLPAVAVTDQGNLFAMVKLYKAARKRGVKPIIGAELCVSEDPARGQRRRLVALCQDTTGYRNLAGLLTRSYTDGQYQSLAHVHPQWLLDGGEGLILLSGGLHGALGQWLAHDTPRNAERRLRPWLEAYPGRFYIEVTRSGRSGEEAYIEAALDLAARCGVPVVATNDACFLYAEDYEAHEARVCIHEGRLLADTRRPRRYSAEQYLRSAEEMRRLFADCPQAIDNSLCIAQRCNLELVLDRYHLPSFPVEAGGTVEDHLSASARQGLAARITRLRESGLEVSEPGYAERLHSELEVINSMGFAGYFLIVADFIRWAKAQGIPVGPGRGSGSGSLVAYALSITELDPIQYDLLFERFLNPERVSMPDFDVDFCMDRRDEVIDYVASRYGRDRVSQIITYGSMAARAVVRDVGRVLGLPYGYVDPIAKLIPFELNMTLDQALAEEPLLRRRQQAEEEVRTLIDLARRLEGLVRNAGRHAGGVVIAPRPLTEFMPLYTEPGGGAPVTQLDMGDVEALGLVKFDFLGLRTLTLIDWAVRDINRGRAAGGQPPLDIGCIPLDDAQTYELIRRAETTAVFQLESRGMKDLVKRLRPDVFEDLVALLALFRPGPLQSGMVDDFIDRKHGRAAVRYLDPRLEPILRPTYGVILYQEQVMQIAQRLAGYSLGAADLLRRAMGKKKPEEMAQQRAIFCAGAAANRVTTEVAGTIFDRMEKFAGYGFNKSHSAAYALIAYQTAWLKAKYPAQFMAAVLSADMDNTDKVVSLIEECRRMRLVLLPPEINSSHYAFSVAGDEHLRYGLGAIKGVGEAAVKALLEERARGGDLRDLYDLCKRVDPRKANRRVLEALIRAGTLDGWGTSRGALLSSLGPAMQSAEQHHKGSQNGQDDLFGFESAPQVMPARPDGVRELSEEERLSGEQETLGHTISGHRLDRYREELARLNVVRLADLKAGAQRVGGEVRAIRSSQSKRGRMAIATLDDGSARADLVVYAEVWAGCTEALAKGRIVIADGEGRLDEFSGGYSLVAKHVRGIAEARTAYDGRLVLHLPGGGFRNGLITDLQRVLDAHRSREGCPVCIAYQGTGAEARLRLDETWRVTPSDALIADLEALIGRAAIEVDYACGAERRSG